MPGQFWKSLGCARSLALLCASLSLLSCGLARPETRPPRLVLLYAPCTVSRLALSPYAADIPYTPNLDAFARESQVFERHQTESGQSGIAFASLFTGSQLAHHGVSYHPTSLPDYNITLAERLASDGYETYAWLAHPMASTTLNYAQGVPVANQHAERLDADDPDFGALLDRLAANHDARAFVMTNFTVTHSPYHGKSLGAFCRKFKPRCGALWQTIELQADKDFYSQNHLQLAFNSKGIRERLEIDDERWARLSASVQLLYEADVHHLDTLFGAVLARIEKAGLADESLVVFTADHGEIGDRANAPLKWTHGYQQAPEVLNIPLIMRGPSLGIEAGRFAAVTRSVDVAPTIEGLVGLKPRLPSPSPGGVGKMARGKADLRFQGRDLGAAVRGRASAQAIPAFTHTALFADAVWEFFGQYKTVASLYPEPSLEYMWVSMREEDRWWTLRRWPTDEFEVSAYDLAVDAGLEHDLFDPSDAAHTAAAERLRRYKADLIAAVENMRSDAGRVSRQEEEELLRSLGYIE